MMGGTSSLTKSSQVPKNASTTATARATIAVMRAGMAAGQGDTATHVPTNNPNASGYAESMKLEAECQFCTHLKPTRGPKVRRMPTGMIAPNTNVTSAQATTTCQLSSTAHLPSFYVFS